MEKKSIFQSHIEDILKIVDENPNCNKEFVYSKLEGSRNTRVDRLNRLIDNELISETKHYGVHNIKTLILTEKGEKALKAIKIINGETIEEENHPTPSTIPADLGQALRPK